MIKSHILDVFHQEKKGGKRFFLFLRIFLYTFLIIVILGFSLLLPHYFTLRNIYDLSLAGKQDLESAALYAKDFDFVKAGIALTSAESNLVEAQDKLAELKFLKYVPWVRKQYDATENLLSSGVETVSALSDLLSIAKEVMSVTEEAGALVNEVNLPQKEITFAKISPEQKREILKKLFESPPRLQGAKAKIDLALLSLSKIKENEVAGTILNAMQPVRDTLITLRDALDQAIPAAEIIPQIAGYPTPKTYLFLLQNSDELRPTGGFIGTFGIVKVKDGEINLFDTHNIYEIDGPAESFLKIDPPWQIKKYLQVNWWFMRDANWSPDFPEAAAKAEQLYHEERGPEENIDAVLAVTPSAIGNLLNLVGNIEIEGQLFTPENLSDVLEYKVEKEYYEKGMPEIQRKEIIGKLADEIFNRLTNLPSSKWLDVFKIAEKTLEEKQFLLYSKSPELQNLIKEEGWAGEVKDFSGDYLSVIDANMASLKTDRVVDKKIDYSLWQASDGKFHAKTTVTYTNHGWFDWRTTRYRTYARIYVPEGSTFVKGEGMMENDKILDPLRRPGQVEIKNELGKTYFGAFISIEPGETKTLSFEYILPENIQKQIEDGLYKLFVQKQAGTSGHPLTLNLNFGKKVKSANPAEEQKEWGDEVYKLQTDLSIDREFEVQF
jgi:hypothetical protein